MSSHNICFYGEIEKIIMKYSSLKSPLESIGLEGHSQKIMFCHFCTKACLVGIHLNCLNKAIPLSTDKICLSAKK